MRRIGSINVHEYKVRMGENESQFRAFSTFIKTIITTTLVSLETDTIDVYNLNGIAQDFEAGGRNRLVIFSNGGFLGSEKVDGRFSFSGREGYIQIEAEDGAPLAEYNPNHNELMILFDLLSVYNDDAKECFRYIMSEFERLVWFPKTLENSWVHSSNKEGLVSRFTTRVKQQKERQLQRERSNLEDYEYKINEYKRKMKEWYDNTLRIRRLLDVEEGNVENIMNQFVKDLDLISQHDKVKDLHIIDGKFHIWTDDIYAYSSDDKRYYIGKMKIVIDIENTDTRFYNLNNPRQGYWTSEDPHPHVSGSGNNACLGNVASTIAELCSRNEIYALTLICIDFLENANVSDPAGAKVRNWDEVDEEGNVIREAEDDLIRCENCGDHVREEDFYGVAYDGFDDGELIDSVHICENCRDNHYTFSENVDEAVHDSIYDEVEDYEF